MNDAKLLSGATSRSHFCTEAINTGLSGPNGTLPDSRRKARTDIWIPPEYKAKVNELAKACGLSRQSILRYFILNYAAKVLQKPETEQPSEGSNVN